MSYSLKGCQGDHDSRLLIPRELSGSHTSTPEIRHEEPGSADSLTGIALTGHSNALSIRGCSRSRRHRPVRSQKSRGEVRNCKEPQGIGAPDIRPSSGCHVRIDP